MRNTTNAEIYSPCYTNGIGTIYFDAVNSSVSETGDEYKIVVEICTNTVSAVYQIPTDENLLRTTLDENSGETVTDRYGNAVWDRVELLPLVKNGTPNFEPAGKTNELALAINNGGTCDNFYRVCAKVDYRGPIRFRIKRVSAAEGSALTAKYVLLDNIIVSYPAMRADMEPCGEYNPNRGGAQVLGQACAWNVPFPSVNDTNILARGNAKYTTNCGNKDADTAEFFTGVKMHYRWRYLEQEYGEWQEVGLDHKNGFKADAPLQLPAGRQGDVEFWFESFLKAPYYEYVDYSGANLGLSGLYTENVAVVTNRANVYFAESMGRDWFVRLREGKSDYESIRLVAITEEEKYEGVFVKTNFVDMAVVGNGMWRGYLKTAEPLAKGVKYRFELMNRQEPGAAEWETNTAVWRATANSETLPVSDILKVADGDDDWATVPCDAVTGYLLFQIDETTRGLTVVHADYQNFNAWNDAKGSVYRGTSTSDDSVDKSGASAKSKDYVESFDNWSDMPSVNKHWREAFEYTTQQQYGDYVSFDSTVTPNNWTAENGMYIYGKYRDAQVQSNGFTDRALQMHGQGKGYIQFVDGAESPRGLESISFKVRLSQFINFDDFAYYDAPLKSTMTNYSFVAASAFDLKKNKSFTGNASLSLIGYYRRDKGFYEFRVEQAKAKNGEYNAQGQVLSLYRWTYDAKGKILSKKLGEKYVDSYGQKDNWPECSSLTGKGYRPLFISLASSPTGTCIVAGYKLSDAVTPSFSTSEISGKQYNMICYRDTSDERLKGGTYGLLSANSEGYFSNYVVFEKPIAQTAQIGPANTFDIFSNNLVTFSNPSGVATSQIRNDLWYIRPARMTAVPVSDVVTALKNVVPEQQIDILTASAGKTDWKLLKSETCDTFGTPKANDIKVYTTSDCSVKIKHNGSTDDIRTDVVIDDIELKQFRGDDWANVGGECIPGLNDASDYRGLTNIIFTSSWIKNKGILLSGRRTTPEKPASIRSPLFDGYNAGAGIGMLSFNYAPAGSSADYKTSLRKVKLLVQIATNNVNSSNIDNIHNFDSATWTTYEKDGKPFVIDFTEKDSSGKYILPENGTFSVYLGLHGVKGVVRLVMDPKVVEDVQDEMDPKNFAEILITDVLCRDEPMLDSGSWWGWNLRTLGGDLDTEKRMLLSDMYSFVRDDSTGTNVVSRGLSLALNNSWAANVEPMKEEAYKAHQPFVQTPTFVSNLVGEVSFKARKFDLGNSQPAQVTLYGSLTGSVDQNWELLEKFVVSNKTYETFSYKTDPSKAYAAFRLAVTGIDGIADPHVQNHKPEGYENPVRVLIDEVVVSEAVRARLAFRNVGAFRTHLDGTGYVSNVPSTAEQPLCNESWGIQCEIFAAQLADEIDFERTPSVRLHWFEGEYPWGYVNWKGVKGAKSALLARATGTNLIYRSSYTTAQDAIVTPSFAPGTVVQYELEVVYYQKDSNVPVTNYLSSAGSWTTPEWYAPVDKNAGKDAFTAYNILDTVAPKWAWINEVNLFGTYNSNYVNTDRDLQFVEIAVPAEADITGWSVRVLEALIGSNIVVTNTIGRFGSADLEPTKPNLTGMASNMVFRVLGNTRSRQSQRLKYADGTLDGVWNVDYPSADVSAEEISSIEPIGIQLVRGSGIVEHEIVALGTNYWSGVWESYTDMQPSNTVNALNRMMKGSDFQYVGEDNAGENLSLSVLTNRGQVSNDWSRVVTMTPGRINEGQQIDPDHPTPNGSSIIIYANLDNVFGHIYQTIGDAVNTNRNQILVIQKGSDRGTNITYTVDPWYELAGVTTNGRAAVATPLAAPRTYQVTVGVGASNNVTVVAGAKVRSDLETDYGLTVDNKYRDAIMKWLEEGSTAKGRWKNYGLEEICPVEFRSLYGTVVTNLTLTQIYWLDIDPTVSNQAFVAGMASAPLPAIKDGYLGSESVTNVKMSVKMFVTNTSENAETYFNGKTAYAPYTLRGLEPGSLSKDLAGNVAWTSVTFKVAGLLANGLTSEQNEQNWVPLRWFVFDDNSFDADFISKIEVKDPLGTESPGYGAGWSEWVEQHGQTPIFFKWAIDTKLKPFTVELLKKENYYGN
ncbi:MAG: hypothetical protein J6S30_00405 [Kiritimatiellae bacterium]|nr:hypothetical protein [Kiritimatiellia bacterium]